MVSPPSTMMSYQLISWCKIFKAYFVCQYDPQQNANNLRWPRDFSVLVQLLLCLPYFFVWLPCFLSYNSWEPHLLTQCKNFVITFPLHETGFLAISSCLYLHDLKSLLFWLLLGLPAILCKFQLFPKHSMYLEFSLIYGRHHICHITHFLHWIVAMIHGIFLCSILKFLS